MKHILALLLLVPALADAGAAPTKINFGTVWYAQAEHGGFYQAVAEGIYAEHGLDVNISMGGPQVNALQLLVSGVTDLCLSFDLQALNAIEENIPVITLAATFQKDPQVIIAHPWAKSLEDLRGKPLLLAGTANVTFWPWLKKEFGYMDAMKRPYTFSVAPFLVDRNVAQQGYLTSEPFAIEQAGIKPKVFLLADHGYPPYGQTIITTRKMAEERPDVVRRFVRASILGWESYLNNPAPGNALIRKHNPRMTDAQLEYGVRKLKEHGIVTGGDAATLGIGAMTEERWKKTYEFMVRVGNLSPKTDYRKAYTMKFLEEIHGASR
ncbi:MAG TPA: ABC transporter substrate-binding protein [Steroidobacteraceae bacterium]